MYKTLTSHLCKMDTLFIDPNRRQLRKCLDDSGFLELLKEIVQQLIDNSSTFKDKTEFAQEKYIKKKKKK